MLGQTQVSRAAFLCLFACLLLSVSPALLAQGARTNPSGAGEEADRDNPAAREAWWARGRTAPKGKSAAELRWKAYQQKIQMRAAAMAAARKAGTFNAAPLVGSTWLPLGPAPLVSNPGSGQDYGFVSGRATSVLVDPADATGNTVYVGGAYGGLWRSTNGLAPSPGNVTWSPMIDAQGTLAVGSIGVQPGNKTGTLSNVVLVGTGETNSSLDSYYGLGILRTTNGSAAQPNWTLITQDKNSNPFHGMGFSRIAFSTANTSLVVAAASTATAGVLDGARSSSVIRGVYFSTDAGASWTLETSVKDGSTNINPVSNSVTTVVYNATAAKFYAVWRFHGFYSSTDGANWTRLTNQPAPTGVGTLNDTSATGCPASLPLPPNPSLCPINRGEIAVVPGRNEMYVWYLDPNDADKGIWQSLDGGATWTNLNDTNITNCGDPFGGCGTAQGSYDLELAAVPNGTSTDLYAGARNIYKCTITGAVTTSTCSGTGVNSFQNLTHVYGCNGHATVHPDQHAIDFAFPLPPGGKNPLYFVHDGGVDRALDGFTGLNSANCFTNQFDSLSGTLGSMTEFVSFSQDPANPTTLLGGTQDNGSPGTSTAGTSAQWHSVNGGDGGYNEINPSNPNEWFVTNTDVSIQKCTLGSACLEANFPVIVSNATVGGDAGSFYTPYILDPQNGSEFLVGTCRVWQGSTSGSGFVASSPNFDTGTTSICTGRETNFVRSLAAGGPKDANGFSKVVYAGTQGFDQLAGGPSGGVVAVSTNASGGVGTWVNATNGINPLAYNVGAIAIDNRDATGNTAYVGIQGFTGTAGSGHVFKTTTAGSSPWIDFSSGLPDVPVNALVVDSSVTPSVVYVGTDVGVFSTPTSAANWIEVGPAPNSGQLGYLPNAPVTRLRMFPAVGPAKRLRASTYGRGIWEFSLVPDYAISLQNTTLTTYPNTPINFSGTATAVGGYAGTVTLTCTGTPPATCTPPGPFVPSGGGTAISVATKNPTAADFNFTLHGSDGTIVHDTPLTLHVVDFNFAVPAIAPINIPQTGTANIPIVPSSNFSDSLQFSCVNPPTNVTCTFSPNPVPAGTTTTSLTIATSGASKGNYSFMVSANAVANPAPAAKTQTVSLTLTAFPDFTLAISNSPVATTVLGSGTFNGTLASANGYTGTVTLTCGTGAPATCTPPAPIVLTAGASQSFTVAASSATVGIFNFNIHGTDGTIAHDAAVTLNVGADFDFASTTASQTVTAGGTGTYTLNFNPDGQATFASDITYSCLATGFPNLSNCTFSPTSLAAGTGATPVTLSIHTTAPIASLNPPAGPWKPSGPLFAFWLSLPAMGIVAMGVGSRSKKRWLATLSGGLLLMTLTGSLAACGGGGGGGGHQPQPGTSPGTYTVMVSATSGTLTHSSTVQLIVQ